MTTGNTSTLTINLLHYAQNLRIIREHLPSECSILAVVKADAYGLGAVPLAQGAIAEGVAMLGVATIAEGIELREAGIEAPILVLLQPHRDDLAAAVKHNLRLTISDLATTEILGDIARKAGTVAEIHCEIDTGMARQGFNLEQAPIQLRKLTRISNVDIEGVFTHFAAANIPDDPFTENQIRAFRQLLRQLEGDGIPYEIVHAANSAALINYPQSAFDMVRTGLMSYGIWPSDAPPEGPALKPVVEWTTTVALVQDLPGGASVSYGRTYRAPSPIRTAAIPIGYADGYRFSLSNRSDVIIRGVRCPVRGQVTMNEIVVDVTRVPEAAPGDAVTLIGSDGKESITVEELATKAETIPYEILTGLGAGVHRVYTQ